MGFKSACALLIYVGLKFNVYTTKLKNGWFQLRKIILY